LISDNDGKEYDFIITNNNQSSSILELDEHLIEHPGIHETKRYKKSTITVETLLKNFNIDITEFEFVNIDIQGAELLALKGMKKILRFAKYLYLEVNIKHLYENCPLIDDLDSFLFDYGFERKETSITIYGWGDALYVKKDLPNNILDNCDQKSNGETLFYNSIRNNINVIFDVGSRFDSEFLDFKGDVHYFEPVLQYIEKLKQSCFENKVSYFNNFCLSDTNDTIWYYPNYQSFYNRINSCNTDDSNNKYKLDVKKASEYIKENNVKHIDFVKIDTEGYELKVLKGFEEYLKIVNIIQFEYGGTFLDNNVKLYEIIEFLKLAGFNNFNYFQ
jgi:FkbM family methyltransferase